MIEKPKTVYELGDKTVRLLDPAHFSDYRGCKSVNTNITSDLRQYISDHAEKVEVR